MSVKITWYEGDLDQLLNGPNGEVAKWLNGLGNEVRTKAIRLCSGEMVNVVTGRLRASIASVMGSKRGKLICVISANVEYAYHVHEGGRGRSGRPFLRQPLEEVLRTL